MTQVAVDLVPSIRLSPSKSRRDSFLSSGRGGSGNIRRSYVSTADERSPDQPVLSARERQSTSTADKTRPSFQPTCSELPTERHGIENKQFTSSGRGGSGNIQPSTSDLEAHPQTASILSQHSAMQAQYEQQLKNVHAESNVIRSSGRGGSGNISNTRQRSISQGPSTAPKRRLFTTKGREKGTKDSDGVTQAHDKQDMNIDRRTSHATYSSGGSSALETRYSEGSSVNVSNVVMSNDSLTADPLASEDALTGQSRKRQSFLFRSSKPPSSAIPLTPPGSPPPTVTLSTSPRSWHTGSHSSRFKAGSSASVVSEDREYVSFLDL